MSLFITAAGHYCKDVESDEDGAEALPPLKALVKEAVGGNVRRIDRFIQLALIGAGRAANAMPDGGGIYLASGYGDVEITVELLESIYRLGHAPKPLSFVNSVSNAAGFYVAKCLGLHGPSQFVTSRYFAVESALQAAAMDLEARRASAALVGAVDTVVLPLDQHRERLGLAPGAPLAEASYWLQLCSDPAGAPVLARLDAIRHFSGCDQMLRELSGEPYPSATQLAFGQFTAADDRRRCMSELGLKELDFSSPYGHSGCRGAEIITGFTQHTADSLLLISGDCYGRFRVLGFSKP